MSPRAVFVSYSQSDRECAFELVAVLEARNIGVWVAPRDVSPAADWAAEIVEAIAQARLMVLVFSAHCNDSPQVRREVERAIHRQLPVLPFRIEDVLPAKSMEYFLSSQHWLDAFPAPREPYYSRLVAHVEQLLDRSPSSVFAPSMQAAATPAVAPERLQRIERELALHVGPIARILVKRAVARAAHWQDLIERLAAEVSDRDRFLEACRSM